MSVQRPIAREIIICATQTHDVFEEKGRRRVHCARTISSPMKQCGVLYEKFQEPCSLRGTGGICTMKLLDGSAVHRACFGVVGFTMNYGTKDCEVLSNGNWPQRAKAMMSKDGQPTSSGKPKCTTSHSAQLKGNVRTVPVWLEGKLVDVCLVTLVHVRGESWCRRFRTDSEQFQVQQWQASDLVAVMTSDAEEDVSTP